MTLHPQAAIFLQRLRSAGAQPDHELSVAEVRERSGRPGTDGEPVGAIRDLTVSGPQGLVVPVRTYAPVTSPVAVVLYLHGGGHVTGTLDSYDGLARRLANRVPAVVVSVGYRRAPEHRCPAAVDDAEAGYRWLVQHRSELGLDRDTPIVIAGDSAGGNNTAVLAIRIRETGLEAPRLQVLIYPTLDAVAYRTGTAYRSYTECGSGYGLSYPDGLWYWDHYLGPDGDPWSAEASPLRASSLAGLAAAYILTVEYDVLRDEGEAYVQRLRQAGVEVRHRHWDGHLHGFLGDPGSYDDADPALTEIAEAIARAATTRGSTDLSERRSDQGQE